VNRIRPNPRSPSTDKSVLLRVLCLGNDALADDALGPEVARQLQQCGSTEVEIIDSPVSGLSLLDYLLDTKHLVVIDTIQTGDVPVGTIHWFREGDGQTVQGGSPHYVGMFDALKMARQLGLPAADDVRIVAVEAGDCLSFGGAMCGAVRAAIPEVVGMVVAMIPALRNQSPEPD